MNENTINVYAETITENRAFADAQLSADDMSANTWKQYRQLCDNIAIAAWNTLGKGSTTDIGLSLSGLFTFFGTDAKAVPEYQKRLLLACVNYKKMQSDAMKKANKALRQAKAKYDEENERNDKDTDTLTLLKADVDNAQATVDTLKAEPYNVWYDITPMLDKSRKHATGKCRKLIEDTIADIIRERSLMTVEELQKEAQRLADERKGRKARKAQEAKAQA